ncbi:MAG: hypothetical protein ACKO8Q_08700, partial [Bacteroidota bacterium]
EFPETYTPSITEANSSPIKNEIISSPAIIEDSKEASVEPQKSFDHQSEKTSTHEEFDILDKHILAAAVSSSIYQEVSENHDVSKDQSVTASNPFKENYESDDNFINWLAGAALEHENEGVELEDVDIKKSEEIIEKFIASEPKITPGKVDQYNQIQLGKDSLEDNFEWVTETMAKLYISQGKTERARRVYKQLIILHPEKSIYYEQQLKSLNSRK